jgi:YggT family protein
LTEPVLRPVRRLIPPMGGFDISPIFVIIALGALTRLLMGFNQLGI